MFRTCSLGEVCCMHDPANETRGRVSFPIHIMFQASVCYSLYYSTDAF